MLHYELRDYLENTFPCFSPPPSPQGLFSPHVQRTKTLLTLRNIPGVRLLRPRLRCHNQLLLCTALGSHASLLFVPSNKPGPCLQALRREPGACRFSTSTGEWGLGRKPGHHCEMLSEARARDLSEPRAQHSGTRKHGRGNGSLQGTQDIILRVLGPVLCCRLPFRVVLSQVSPPEFIPTL